MSKREEYINKLKAQLDEWSAEIGRLEARSEKIKADARSKYREQIEKLHRERDEMKQKLAEIQKAGEDTWEDLQKGADKAWTNLKETVQKIRSRFE